MKQSRDEDDERQFLLEDYESDEEQGSKAKPMLEDGLSAETRQLMEKYVHSS